MHEVLVNRFGGLSLPRKSVVRLTDRPDMALDVYRGRKTTIQPTNQLCSFYFSGAGKFRLVHGLRQRILIFQTYVGILNLRSDVTYALSRKPLFDVKCDKKE